MKYIIKFANIAKNTLQFYEPYSCKEAGLIQPPPLPRYELLLISL